jgi:hypothetical protein
MNARLTREQLTQKVIELIPQCEDMEPLDFAIAVVAPAYTVLVADTERDKDSGSGSCVVSWDAASLTLIAKPS